MSGELPAGWRKQLQDFVDATVAKPAAVATRIASQQVLNVLGAALPELLGGSADLTWSNNTDFKGYQTITPQQVAGNYLHYGVREFGMTRRS